jgi:hypothetical protein
MTVPGAKDNDIVHDCQVTAKLAVRLMKIKPYSEPEKMLDMAQKLLKENKYKGSFGDLEFISNMYTAMALETDPQTDEFMKKATKLELEKMEEEHEVSCLKEALKDPEETKDGK